MRCGCNPANQNKQLVRLHWGEGVEVLYKMPFKQWVRLFQFPPPPRKREGNPILCWPVILAYMSSVWRANLIRTKWRNKWRSGGNRTESVTAIHLVQTSRSCTHFPEHLMYDSKVKPLNNSQLIHAMSWARNCDVIWRGTWWHVNGNLGLVEVGSKPMGASIDTAGGVQVEVEQA